MTGVYRYASSMHNPSHLAAVTFRQFSGTQRRLRGRRGARVAVRAQAVHDQLAQLAVHLVAVVHQVRVPHRVLRARLRQRVPVDHRQRRRLRELRLHTRGVVQSDAHTLMYTHMYANPGGAALEGLEGAAVVDFALGGAGAKAGGGGAAGGGVGGGAGSAA